MGAQSAALAVSKIDRGLLRHWVFGDCLVGAHQDANLAPFASIEKKAPARFGHRFLGRHRRRRLVSVRVFPFLGPVRFGQRTFGAPSHAKTSLAILRAQLMPPATASTIVAGPVSR